MKQPDTKEATTRPVERAAFTVADAARYVGMGRGRIYSAMNAGDLPARKHGRRTVLPRRDLDIWLENLPLYEISPKATD